MKKISALLIVCVFFPIIQVSTANETPEKPTIIPRISWWANEQYTSRESTYWQDILTSRANYVPPYVSPAVVQKRQADYKKAINYINENFSKENTITQKLSYDIESEFKLAWPQKYTDYVNAIVIHHTASEYSDSLSGIRDIYKYHSLSRQWGDIGYNYIIWYDGEIFEWRKWGKYVSSAHSKWNNNSTTWIAIMWDYSHKAINENQYQSLEKLVKYLAWEYGIDFNNKYYYHTNCAGEKCNTFPLETYLDSTLVGHRDTGHTSCPWDELYAQIQQIREDNQEFTRWFKSVKRGDRVPTSREEYTLQTPEMKRILELLGKYSDSELEAFLVLIHERLKTEQSESKRVTLQMVKIGILSILRS